MYKHLLCTSLVNDNFFQNQKIIEKLLTIINRKIEHDIGQKANGLLKMNKSVVPTVRRDRKLETYFIRV